MHLSKYEVSSMYKRRKGYDLFCIWELSIYHTYLYVKKLTPKSSVYHKFWNVSPVENICRGLSFFFRKLDHRLGKTFFKRGGVWLIRLSRKVNVFCTWNECYTVYSSVQIHKCLGNISQLYVTYYTLDFTRQSD